MRTALLDRPTRSRRVGALSIPAPVEGWDTSEALADMKPKRAIRLDNFFPRSEYVELRKGYAGFSRLANATAPVETLMAHHGNLQSRLFAASGVSIYDVTDGGLVNDPALTDLGSARFKFVNFANAGGSYLWICNGVTAPRLFDSDNSETWMTAAITGVDPAAICDVEAFKGRLWLTLEDSTRVAYLGIEAIQGAATTFELGSVMTMGGVILTIGTWSLDGGDGPDDYLVFVTTKGQVIVYSGLDPENADSWSLVGVYEIGTPVGRRCLMKMGADLAIICVDGVKPLSQVMGLDRSLQRRQTITQRISTAIAEAARSYAGNFGWQMLTYPRGSRAILNVPIIESELSHQYVMNTDTGAWCRFTGQNAACWAVFQDRLFFGVRGQVMEADVTGSDTDGPIVGDIKTAFQYGGGSATLKRYTMAQPLMNAEDGINIAIGVDTDFADGLELRPLPSNVAEVSRWGSFVWGRDPWAQPVTQRRDWIPIQGYGQCAAVRVRVEIGEAAMTSKWGSFVWGRDPWSASERAETLFQVNGFNITAEAGGYL